jgi:tryptophan synthase alpha chain
VNATRDALDATFERARAEGRGVLIPYLTAGYPNPASFADLAVAVLDAGADALELGIPFSDPLLDGPAIQRSQGEALAAGVTPADCLRFAGEIHARSGKPLLFFGAYNPIFAYGVQRFCAAAAEAGVSGLIVPDLPFEEQPELRAATREAGLCVVQLVAPTSTPERVRRVCSAAEGFVYCISVAGVTGARGSVASTARPLVERVRGCTDVPVAVGFGIAGPDAAREVVSFADGAVVGSALINLVGETPGPRRIEAAARFIEILADAVRGAGSAING